jgi:2-polyprenyl-3-methyl-5-hydroxy-6-metoxy-1,4-benzoquinol methylase
VHEVSDPCSFLSEIHEAVKPTGKFLLAEPKGHVSQKDFEMMVSMAEDIGFEVIERPQIGRSRAVLLEKRN